MIDVIEHIKTFEAGKLLPKIHNLLNVNRKVTIVTPSYTSGWFVLEKAFDKIQLVPRFDGEEHLATYNTKYLEDLFSKQFSVKEMTTFTT